MFQLWYGGRDNRRRARNLCDMPPIVNLDIGSDAVMMQMLPI